MSTNSTLQNHQLNDIRENKIVNLDKRLLLFIGTAVVQSFISINCINKSKTHLMTDFKSRQKLSWESMFYSLQRIDLLIVSISGAGIYVILETLRFLSENKMEIGLGLKISSCAFVFAILVNLLSQIFGYKANEQDYLMCELENDQENKEKNKAKIKKYNDSSDCFSNWTNILNYISMILLALGLFSLLYFFLTTF